MRKVYLAIALGFCCQGILAQQTFYRWKVEAEAGVSCSVLDTDVSGLSETYYKVRPGFTAAIGAEYNIVDQLAVGTGIRFVQRDYLYQNLGGDSWNTRYNNNFISIPLHVGYYLLHNPYHEKGLWIKPQVGVYYEYFTSMHTKGMYPMNIMEGYKGEGTYIRYNTTYDFRKNENHLRRSLFGDRKSVV